ncbi:MAG: MBL fold metallo-hydrolase [Clostridia bacterium]|nr:MBL fold metallo-hydrolase [Clostridia bacterium]
MKIERLISGGLMTNGYFVYDERAMKGYLIDPDGNPKKFLDRIKTLKLDLKGIILTHGHYDHRGAAPRIIDEYRCDVLIHEKEEGIPLKITTYLKDNDEVIFGKETLRVVNTPGHTKGSICLISEDGKTIFTGDTIFNVDLGRTDLGSGSLSDMKKSIKNIVSQWPDDTMIYPGHGDPCSMAFVRKQNWEYNDIINEKI